MTSLHWIGFAQQPGKGTPGSSLITHWRRKNMFKFDRVAGLSPGTAGSARDPHISPRWLARCPAEWEQCHQQYTNCVKNKVTKKGDNNVTKRGDNKVTKKGDNTRNCHLQSDSANATGTSRHRPGAAWSAEPTRGLTACSSISALKRIYVVTIKDLVETEVPCLKD